MPCLAAPTIPIPGAISVLLPSLSFDVSTPSLGITACCAIESIPPYSLSIPIGSLGIPGVAAVLQPLMTAVMTAVDTLNTLLDSLQVSCPLD